MAKYKVGDKVRIVSEKPDDIMFVEPMAKYLGKVLTVSEVEETPLEGTIYRFREAQYEGVALSMYRLLGLGAGSWNFKEDWISGLALGEKSVNYPGSGYKVVLHFIGKTTTATLMHGDRAVKTAEAKCSPVDQFQYGEGAKIAVERLFEEKRPVANDDEIKKAIAAGVAEAHKKGHRGKIGDKFMVIGNDPGMKTHHFFEIGEIVTLAEFSRPSSRYINRYGMRQWVRDEDVRPYKETSK